MMKPILGEIVGIAKCIDFSMALKYKVREYEKGDKTPVLIVKGFPGLWTNNSDVTYLQNKGYPVYILDSGVQIQSLKYLENRISAFLDNHDFNKVILLGFSMGGLAALDYIVNYGYERIEKVIAISPPLCGTRLSKILNFIPAFADMHKDSLMIKRVNKHKFDNNIAFATYANYDQLLLPVDKTTQTTVKLNEVCVRGHGYSQWTSNTKQFLDTVF